MIARLAGPATVAAGLVAALAAAGAFAQAAGQAPSGQAPAAQPPTARARPNIVYIMTDDHAAHAISAYGSKINQTPHLDRLAREGALFTNVFATNAICTPSRATILTGQYSHLNGVTMFNRFDSTRMTVARLLQQGGYHTGMVGKWHLGSDPQGFDHWEIFPGQGEYREPVLYTATSQKKYTGRYATDVVTDLGIDFIARRPRDKPFFLMLHHKAPHRPWVPSQEHGQRFSRLRIPEPVTLFDDYTTRTDALRENKQRLATDLTPGDLKQDPPAGLQGADLTRWKYQRYMQDYLATVQSVDDSIGRVLDALDKEGLARDTMVIYTSDQGFFLGDHGLFDKRFMYEESLRMPFLVRWPAAIAAGSRIEAMGLNVDFAPTFLDVAGLPASSDMQGRSLVPVLRGAAPADWRTSMYYRYYHDPGHHNTRAHYGVRTKTHKLIYFWKKDQWELFDLVADPYELHNLYGQPGMDSLTETLKTELARLKREARDDDQLANEQIPQGVDGTVQELRGQ
jgi:arylsulfatase A-like enzyme